MANHLKVNCSNDKWETAVRSKKRIISVMIRRWSVCEFMNIIVDSGLILVGTNR